MVLDGRTCLLLYLTDIIEKYVHKILILAEGIGRKYRNFGKFFAWEWLTDEQN
jgi:hypothetical protein